jgi:predicted enzyme related to lactoylglutathione lyase
VKPNPIGWFEIYVQDMGRARVFYEAVFQGALSPLPNPEGDTSGTEMWAFPSGMDTYGAPGALVKMPGYPSGSGGTLVYFSCADCAEEAGRAAAHGGRVFREKFAIGEYGFVAMLTDTEGNLIGLHSMA